MKSSLLWRILPYSSLKVKTALSQKYNILYRQNLRSSQTGPKIQNLLRYSGKCVVMTMYYSVLQSKCFQCTFLSTDASGDLVSHMITCAMAWCDGYTAPLLVPLSGWLQPPLPLQIKSKISQHFLDCSEVSGSLD